MQILAFDIGNIFMRLCLMIDTIIYKAIGWMYSIFYTIASSRVFSNEVVTQFLNRIYSIIGVVMLFIVAYSLLNVIINPDNMSKGKSTPTKIVFNVVLSLISIIFIPTIFNFGYSLQGAVMQENVLGKLILGSTSTDSVNDVAGGRFSVNVFEASFYLTENADEEVKAEYDDYTELAAANNDLSYFDNFIADDQNYIEDGYINYNYILCGLIGCFVLYCLLTFCFDVGLRAVKLLFLEVIAPLPSLLLIVPGQDKVFKAWVKETLRTFLSLFLRVILIFFAIFLINAVDRAIETGGLFNVTGSSNSVVLFAKVFIILGILMFAKQAPKLMETLFGFKLEGGMLDLKKRLSESGASAIFGGFVGGAFGAASGLKGAQEGAAARNATASQRRLAAASGLFHGARLGGKAGSQGRWSDLGSSYKYAKQNQAAWAHMDPSKKSFANWFNVQKEMLYDNFGYPSYYENLITNKEIQYNAENSGLNRALQSLDMSSKDKLTEIEKTHKFDKRKKNNDGAIAISKEIEDDAKKAVLADGYKGTTHAVLLSRDQSGNYINTSKNITGSQIQAYKDMYDDALANNEITAEQHKNMTLELDSAMKRLTSNYLTNNMVMYNRDQSLYTDPNAKKKALDLYKSEYVSVLQGSAEYKYSNSSVQQLLTDMWQKEAESQFNELLNNTSDNKVKLSLVNKINSYNDSMKYKGDTAIGVDENGVKVDPILEKLSKESTNLGSELLKSFKALSKANDLIELEKSDIYRNTTVEYTNENNVKTQIMLNQVGAERTRITDTTKQNTEDLKDFKMAHADEEQFSKIAQERNKYGFKHKSKPKK